MELRYKIVLALFYILNIISFVFIFILNKIYVLLDKIIYKWKESEMKIYE